TRTAARQEAFAGWICCGSTSTVSVIFSPAAALEVEERVELRGDRPGFRTGVAVAVAARGVPRPRGGETAAPGTDVVAEFSESTLLTTTTRMFSTFEGVGARGD